MVDWDKLELCPVNSYDVKLGMIILLNNPPTPCKITNLKTTRPGKHGAGKIRLEGISIWDGTQSLDVVRHPSTLTAVPLLQQEYLVLDVSSEDGTCVLMDNDSNVHENMKIRSGDLMKAKTLLDSGPEDVVVTVETIMGVQSATNPVKKT